jgi:hypothetical protein
MPKDVPPKVCGPKSVSNAYIPETVLIGWARSNMALDWWAHKICALYAKVLSLDRCR